MLPNTDDTPIDNSKKLGEKLWRMIEFQQARSVISAYVTDKDDNTVIAFAKIALMHHERCVFLLKAFIKRYSRTGQLGEKPNENSDSKA